MFSIFIHNNSDSETVEMDITQAIQTTGGNCPEGMCNSNMHCTWIYLHEWSCYDNNVIIITHNYTSFESSVCTAQLTLQLKAQVTKNGIDINTLCNTTTCM